MIFGVFEEHLKKLSHIMQLNNEIVTKNKVLFEKYYPNNKKILCYYLHIAMKHLQALG